MKTRIGMQQWVNPDKEIIVDSKSLPRMKRVVPKLILLLIKGYVTFILIPITWLLKKIGMETRVLSMIGNGQMGWGGAKGVFKGYRPTCHDVFVSTFSKSGTNWMMQIAHQISFRGDGNYEHIHDVVVWPDLGGVMKDRISIPLKDEVVQQVSPSKLRVIKTHLGACHVPYDDSAYYLTVVRDPKEIFVSSFYFGKESFGPLMTDVDAWLELFLSKGFPFNFGSTWAEHTAGYWELREKSNVLVLAYQQMKDDLADCVRKISNSLGVNLNEEELGQVVEKSSFSYMSNIDHKFRPFPDGTIPWQGDFRMMRRGKSGNSNELISLQQQMRIDEYFQNELKMLSSDFPYADFFKIAG